MGRTSDGIGVLKTFWPNDEVTKAEAITIISRIFWKNLYSSEEDQKRYEGHLNHLMGIGVVEDDENINDPFSRKEFYGTLKKIYTLDL